MKLRVATWNMDHWKGVGRDRDHTAKAWAFVRELGADIVLLQEAVPPPAGFEATVLPSPDAAERWTSGGRASFGTAVAVFGHASEEVPIGPLEGDRTTRLTQTHPGAFTAARVTMGAQQVIAVSLYGILEGPLLDKDTYSVTTMHRSLSDLSPLLNARSKARIIGGDWNVSTQMSPPHRVAHRVVFDRLAAFGLGSCTVATSASRARLPGLPVRRRRRVQARPDASASKEQATVASTTSSRRRSSSWAGSRRAVLWMRSERGR